MWCEPEFTKFLIWRVISVVYRVTLHLLPGHHRLHLNLIVVGVELDDDRVPGIAGLGAPDPVLALRRFVSPGGLWARYSTLADDALRAIIMALVPTTVSVSLSFPPFDSVFFSPFSRCLHSSAFHNFILLQPTSGCFSIQGRRWISPADVSLVKCA